MILVIAEFTIPLLGFVALNKFLVADKSEKEKKKPLQLAFYIVGGLTLLFAIMPSMFFDFTTDKDIMPIVQGKEIPNGFLEGLAFDRAGLLSADAWRSFIFIALTFATLWMYLKNKLQSKYVILIVGVLILADMWTVNKRYLNDDHFVRKSKVETPYQPTQADNQILNDKDPNFRVYNQSVSTFNDASTSYFHKSIGGYHGAKLKRYQELIENHISKGNMAVLNMLNTKYFINPKGQAQQNPAAMGNAWFVNSVNIVPNADAEIDALNNLDVRNKAVVDSRFKDLVIQNSSNENSSILLTEYKPNYLKYTSTSTSDGIVIFSEIYYEKGWNAYVDGELKPHFRANYVLRGMQVPTGNHIIEFKFEPKTYQIGESVSLASSIILLLLLGFVSFKEFKD